MFFIVEVLKVCENVSVTSAFGSVHLFRSEQKMERLQQITKPGSWIKQTQDCTNDPV